MTEEELFPFETKSFRCSCCERQSLLWVPRCASCGRWNSFRASKDAIAKYRYNRIRKRFPARNPQHAGQIVSDYLGKPSEDDDEEDEIPERETKEAVPLGQVETTEPDRIATGISVLDDVLGGGAVVGTSILLGGEPGVGKSTLMTQVISGLTKRRGTTLYASGEEAKERLAIRAKRLDLFEKNKHLATNLMVLEANDFDNVIDTIEGFEPSAIMLDSLQVFLSSEVQGGLTSPKQLKYMCQKMTSLAQELGAVAFIISQFTKEDDFCGPRALEHWVDVTLKLKHVMDDEGTKTGRIELSSGKNRFTTGVDKGYFRMTERGLVEFLEDPAPKPHRSARSKTNFRFKKSKRDYQDA